MLELESRVLLHIIAMRRQPLVDAAQMRLRCGSMHINEATNHWTEQSFRPSMRPVKRSWQSLGPGLPKCLNGFSLPNPSAQQKSAGCHPAFDNLFGSLNSELLSPPELANESQTIYLSPRFSASRWLDSE